MVVAFAVLVEVVGAGERWRVDVDDPPAFITITRIPITIRVPVKIALEPNAIEVGCARRGVAFVNVGLW